MWNALLVWSVQEIFNEIRLTELTMGREITERIVERVGIFRELSNEFDFGSCRSSI